MSYTRVRVSNRDLKSFKQHKLLFIIQITPLIVFRYHYRLTTLRVLTHLQAQPTHFVHYNLCIIIARPYKYFWNFRKPIQ